MANLVSVSTLNGRSVTDEVVGYAKSLPDGKAVLVTDVANELKIAHGTVERVARSAGVTIIAYAEINGASRKRSYLVNQKTAKAWHQAQNK